MVRTRPGQGVTGKGPRARACVRRATEFDPLRRFEALPGRLLPPHPTVPRTVGLRTSCPRTTARGLHRPQIRLSKGRGSAGAASRRAAPLALRRDWEAKPCCRASSPARRRRTRRGLDHSARAQPVPLAWAVRVSGRYRQAETRRLGARSTRTAAFTRARATGNVALTSIVWCASLHPS